MRGHAVALVPGFLGFDHRRGTTYFADRFIAGLRARLEAGTGTSFPVVPVTTLPFGSLAARQDRLLTDLARLDAKLGEPYWHLVGHSTGGVDAALLARTQRLRNDGQRTIFSSESLDFPRLVSVTTVSAPHYGTCLALSSLALLLQRRPSLHGLLDALEAGADVLRRDRLQERLQFVLPALMSGHISDFYGHLLSNELAGDLQPNVVGDLTQSGANRRSGVRISSFATLAPPPELEGRVADDLFRDLWRWTQEKATSEGLLAPPPFPVVAPAQWIGSSPQIPSVDARSNDGVVNTNRQIDGTFAGLIAGDHGDVLGRYRRVDLLDGGVIDPGLLTSGAEFGDEQFFRVLDAVGGTIHRNE
jgi:pimeloyl-ACP methyl ester carboxylesterase